MICWYVGFLAAREDAPWWQRRFRHGYAHCWSARRIDDNLWLWIEWTPEAVLCGHASDSMIRRASANAHEVLVWEYEAPTTPPPVRPIIALHHCASLVAHAIGIRPRPFATPYWLACALRRRGARVLMKAGHESAR